jgi:hypothetical protein
MYIPEIAFESFHFPLEAVNIPEKENIRMTHQTKKKTTCLMLVSEQRRRVM